MSLGKSRLQTMYELFSVGEGLEAMDEEQLKVHFQDHVRKLRRMALLLMVCAFLAFLSLLSLAIVGVKVWWIYSGLFLCVGGAGCLLSVLAYHLLLAFEDLSDRIPDLRRSFERQIRLTASVGCIAVIAASLCFIIPIHKSPGLIVLAVFAFPVTALATFLGWTVLPTWAMQKLVLLPLAVFVVAVAAVQFPVTANYVGWLASHADRFLLRKTRESMPAGVVPERTSVPADCNITFFDVATREPIVWYHRTDGDFELWNNPGGDPITGAEFKLADTEEEREAILAWCTRLHVQTKQPTKASPKFNLCMHVRQIEDGRVVGGDSARLVLETLVRRTGLSVGAPSSTATSEDEPCPAGFAEYVIDATVTATRLGPSQISTGTIFRWRVHFDATIRELATGKSIVSRSAETREVHKEVADGLSMEAFASAAREWGPVLINDFVSTLRNAP